MQVICAVSASSVFCRRCCGVRSRAGYRPSFGSESISAISAAFWIEAGGACRLEFSHALLASVVGQPEKELTSALDRLIAAGLLFRRGMPPHATYLFKHALVQDAAYGTLLRNPRRTLHGRLLKIARVETFGEPAIDRSQKVAGSTFTL